MAKDPRYGAANAGPAEALARATEQAAALDKSFKGLTTAETANTKAVAANVAARSEQVALMQRQVTAISALIDRLGVETKAVGSLTAQYRSLAAARGAAGKAGASVGATPVVQYGAAESSGRIGTLDAAALSNAERRGAQRAAQGAAASAAASAAATAAAPRGISPGRVTPAPSEPVPPVERGKFGVPSAAPFAAAAPVAPVAVPDVYAQQVARRRAREGAETLLLSAPAQIERRFPDPGERLTGGRATAQAQLVSAPARLDPNLNRLSTLYSAQEFEKMSDAQRHAVVTGAQLNATQAEEIATQQALNREVAASVPIYAQSSNVLQRHGALSTEFIGALARGEVTVRDFGNSITQTIGKFGGWAVAGGLVYGAYDALKKFGQGAIETQSGVSQLERSLDGVNKGAAAAGFRKLATETNLPIKTVASAQFYAARAFPTEGASKEVARTALLAEKLDEVPVQDAVKTFAALNVSFHESPKDIARTFNELDVGQLKFNARLQQTLPAIGRAASSFAAAGGTPQELNEQIIELYRTTGGGGGTGGGNPATALIREPANLRRAEAQQTLVAFGFQPRDVFKDVGKFNREVQELAPNLSDKQLQTLAKAAGGGSALGLRYFLPLFRAGQSGLPEEVHEQEVKSEGSAARDLEKKLSQVNEQFKKIGITFETVGSEIGEGGVVTGLTALASIIQFVGRTVGGALGPFERLGGVIGSVFSAVPNAAKTGIELAGATALIARFAGSGRGLATRGLLGEVYTPARGVLGTDSAQQRLNLRSANQREFEALQGEQGQLGGRSRALRIRAQQAQRELDEHNALYGTTLDERGLAKTPEGQEVIADRHTLRSRAANATLASEESRLAYESNLAAQRENRRGDQLLRRRGSTKQYLEEFGYPEEVQRSADRNYEERRATGPAAAGVQRFGKATSEGIQRVAVANTEAMTQVAAAAAAGAETGTAGAASAAQAESRLGALALPSSVKSRLAGLNFSGYGSTLFRAFNTTLLTGLAATVAGEAIGGKLGGDIQNAGSYAALGAGAGSLFGGAGAVAGGALGAALGLAHADRGKLSTGKSAYLGVLEGGEAVANVIVGGLTGGIETSVTNLFGVESAGEKRVNAERQVVADQEKRRAKVVKEHERQINAYATRGFKPGQGETPAVAERKEAGLLNSEGLAEFTELVGEHGLTEEASKKLDAEIKRLDALSKLTSGTARGRTATQEVLSRSAQAIGRVGVEPEQAAAYSEIINTATTDQLAQVTERFKHNILTAKTVGQRKAALKLAQDESQSAERQLLTLPRNDREEKVAYGDQLQNTRKEALALAEEGNLPAALAKIRSFGGKATSAKDIKKELSGTESEIDNFLKEIESFKEEAPRIKALLAQVVKEAAKQTAEGNINLLTAEEGLEVAELGPAQSGKARELSRKKLVEKKGELESVKKDLTPPEFTEKNDAIKQQLIEKQRQKETESVEIVQARSKLTESQVGANNPVGLAEARLSGAEKVSAAIQKSAQYKLPEKLSAQASVNEAARALSETAHSQQEQLVQTEGQIRAALQPGNAVAQAQAALQTASALAAIARNPVEAAQARLLYIEAENQLREAQKQRIQTHVELLESTTNVPLTRIADELRGAKQKLKFDKGPEEKEKGRAEINNLRIKQAEEERQEKENELKFEAGTNRISPQQEYEGFQRLLKNAKKYKITPQQRRGIEQEEYNILTASNRDFNVGSVAQAPTLYDALTLTNQRTAVARGAPNVDVSQAHHGAQLHQTNHVSIIVTGSGDPRKTAEAVAVKMGRVLRVNTRAQLRSAGLTR